jgi:hypothetical protein
MILSKEQLLLKECVYPYHKLFKKPEILNHFKKFPMTLENMAQKLTEEAMAHASRGKLKWNDGDHEDYTDGSDQKTGTCRAPRINSPTGGTEISNVVNQYGVLKNGAIRAIIYNKLTNSLDYFYFPKKVWSKHVKQNSISGPSGGRLLFSYNNNKKEYKDWAENCRVASFKELSNITEENFKEKLALGKR